VYNTLERPSHIAVFNDNGTTRYVLKVDAYVQHNVWIRHQFRSSAHPWLRATSVRLGVNNVLDTDPPLADEGFGFFTGSANPRGRQFTLEINRKL